MGTDAYQAHKERARRRQAQLSKEGRDLGQLPPVVDVERRGRCERDFKAFCETYLRHWFPKPWSTDHLRVIGIIEVTVITGGRFAYAMPRGSGKTTLVAAAILWAALYGHRRFVIILGAEKTAAAEILEGIKDELEFGDELGADFPEVCHPLRALEGRANRCKGQTHGGRPTRSKWGTFEIVLPTIQGSAASGVIIRARGLLQRLRGMKGTSAPPDDDNEELDRTPPRPDLVAIDDPQDDETAGSLRLIGKRMKVITKTVIGLAGPGKKIAAFMPCTVIERDDVADQILDRAKHPTWHGLKMKALYTFPTNLDLWHQYWEMRVEDLIADRGVERSNKFYADNRAAMDAGAVVAWESRYEDDELSAVQHLMNKFMESPEAFAAEQQNEPIEESNEVSQLTADAIKLRLNRAPRGVVPSDAQRLTAFVDVHNDLLFWMVVAWGQGFDGWIIDYGVYPEQSRRSFTLRTARPKMGDKHGDAGFEAMLYAGLTACCEGFLPRAWLRENGDELRVEACLVDAHWGESTATVKKFCKQSAFASQLLPSFGVYVGASNIPFTKRARKKGDRTGPEWMIPAADRHVAFDTNYWKSFCAARLTSKMGAPGGLTLFGDRPDRHDLLAAHLTAEYRVPVEGRGRKCDEWKLHTGRDNHWLDCLVGCAVGASTLGVVLPEAHVARPKRKVVSFAEQQRQARERREKK